MDQLEALERLARLKDSGALTEREFNAQKTRLLNGNGAPRDTRNTPRPDNSDTERAIERFRGSTVGWMFGSFAGWITLLLCLLPIDALLASAGDRLVSLSAIGTGLGVLSITLKWISNQSASYELTSQRMILRTGIIFKRVDEIELFRVKDVRVDFSLVNQITGIGTICLRSSDASSHGADFTMRDVPKARVLRETLRTLIDQARQRRRVREVDVDGAYA